MLKILVADDDGLMRRLLNKSLVEVGRMRVLTLEDALTIVEAAAAFRPDLIVLDVLMPGLDGPEALAALRADRRTADIPVMFLTANEGPGVEYELRRLGAVDVLFKPIRPVPLCHRIERAMRRIVSVA